MKRVRITNRKDGMGLLVTGLEHAKVRRVVLVADPLVPPRVFLELLGHEVDIDLADVVVDDAGAAGLSPGAALVTESREEFRARSGACDHGLLCACEDPRDVGYQDRAPAPPAGPCLTCGGPHESPPPPGPTPLVSTPEDAARERERRAAWCRSHGGRS